MWLRSAILERTRGSVFHCLCPYLERVFIINEPQTGTTSSFTRCTFYLTRNYTRDNVNIIDQSYLCGKIHISFHTKARKVIKFGLVKALLEVPSQPEICFCGSKRDWWKWRKIILNYKCWLSKLLTRIYCWVYKVNVRVKLEVSW